MKKIHIILIATLAVLSAACGAPDESIEEPIAGPPELEAVKNGGGGSCPTSLTCPASLPGYPIFMYSSNNCGGSISCVYRNAQYQISSTVLHPPSGCTDCCCGFYCPDPRCGELTYCAGWSCEAP